MHTLEGHPVHLHLHVRTPQQDSLIEPQQLVLIIGPQVLRSMQLYQPYIQLLTAALPQLIPDLHVNKLESWNLARDSLDQPDLNSLLT